MEFKDFKQLLQKNFAEMSEGVDCLFEVDADKDELWNLYLDSFPEGTNEILRERREFDCSACHHFVRAFGNVVTINDNEIRNIWDFEVSDSKYQVVVKALSNYIGARSVSNVYLSKESKIGTNINYEEGKDGKVTEWHHFYLELPDKFVNKSRESIDTIKGEYKATRDVFKRSLEEITQESIETVLELISQNSLYKGEEWKTVLESFLKYKKEFDKLSENKKDNFAWEQSIKSGPVIGKIRNHSIGTLLTNISENMDLDVAVKKYEAIVAPTNYKRPKPIFTKQMLKKAEETVKELGYMDSLSRRFATLDDITVNNILFSNKDSAKRMGGNVFEEMAEDISIDPKKFSRVEEVPIKEFIENILPSAKELEIFLENKHSNNLVSLIAPENKNAKTMFKWDNGFSWAYAGNITDSMKERVKSAGGNVEGVLRFSIQWNDGTEHDMNDLDAHCVEPEGNEIFFSNMQNQETTGMLDVDVIDPILGKPAVENITWTNKNQMEKGKYQFFVHNYTHRGGKNGFKAEIEFDGQRFEFEYNKEVRQNEDVQVAEVTFDGDKFRIKEMIPSSLATKDIWNLKTNQFIPVSVVMYSPNYWDEQLGIGHRHFFFMLKDCINSEKPNGFYNEFLKYELAKNKKVFEALGSRMAVTDVEDQLSGLGFSSTKRNEVLVKIKGSSERIIKIKI